MIRYSKEFVYYLGFLWSDGFIERTRIGIEIIEEDALNIIDSIKSIDFIKICTMNRHRKNRKPQMTIYFCNVKLYDDYFNKYFINKSFKSADILIDNIPLELRRYFYLGLIDGDGCFYINNVNTIRQFTITSSYEQDWKHMIDLFSSLGVKYGIKRVENKNGNKSSLIRVSNHNDIVKIYNYLYPNGYEFGLKRKHDKCSLIVNKIPKFKVNNSLINKESLIKNIEDGLSILEISSNLCCSWRKIYNFCKRNDIFYKKGFFSGV